MEELKAIIKELKNLCVSEGLNVSPDILFDASVRIYNSNSIHKQGKISNKFTPLTEPFINSPATQKQIDTLYKLNADFDAKTITKDHASEIISRYLPQKDYDGKDKVRNNNKFRS